MSLAWLEVPAPTGDLATMQDCADLLAVLGRRIDDGADRVVRIGAGVGEAWDSEAGRVFRQEQAAAREAVATLGLAHASAAAQVEAYALEWDAARRASDAAREDIEGALQGYAGAARAALDDVAGLLERVLDNPLVDAIGHVVPLVREVQQRVAAWEPPSGVPVLALVPVAPLVPIAEEHVLDQLRSAGEWAVSRVLDGIDAVLGLVEKVVGVGLSAAIDLVRAVERGFAAAVAAAQALARAAIAALVDAGVRTAAAIRNVVTGLVVLWEVGIDLVQQQLDHLLELGKELLAALYIGYEVLAALAGVVLVLRRLQNPFNLFRLGERRVDESLDDEAYLRWRDPQWRQHVVELADLADSSYDGSGAPPGWTRLESIEGPEGFAAAVFRDASGRVVVAFRGSEGSPLDIRDWSQDSLNAADVPTAQGLWAIRTATRLSERYPDLEFTGHSLGGSLASTASITTGAPAVTFNAAGVGAGNHTAAVLAGQGAGVSEEQITNLSTTNDFLTELQEHAPVYAAAGGQLTIASNTGSPVSAHGLDAFEEFDRIREAAR